MESGDKPNPIFFNDKKNNTPYINLTNDFKPFIAHDRYSPPYFYIPTKKTYYKNDISLPEKKTYTPKTEFEKRSDKEFYRTFYSEEFASIMADYDDVVAQFIKHNPHAQFSFDPLTGSIDTQPGSASAIQLRTFIQRVLPYGVPASTFEPQGSIRRIEERPWFTLLNGIDIAGHTKSLLDLLKLGILSKAIKNVTLEELRNNRLNGSNRIALKTFYRRRQLFWHPDMWNQEDGLNAKQRITIEEMSQRINHLKLFID